MSCRTLNVFKILFILFSVTISCASCWWRENPEREQKLLIQETIIERQNQEFERQEKESEDLRRQDYHNKRLRQYE